MAQRRKKKTKTPAWESGFAIAAMQRQLRDTGTVLSAIVQRVDALAGLPPCTVATLELVRKHDEHLERIGFNLNRDRTVVEELTARVQTLIEMLPQRAQHEQNLQDNINKVDLQLRSLADHFATGISLAQDITKPAPVNSIAARVLTLLETWTSTQIRGDALTVMLARVAKRTKVKPAVRETGQRIVKSRGGVPVVESVVHKRARKR